MCTRLTDSKPFQSHSQTTLLPLTTLMMEAVSPSETTVHIYQVHGATSQKTGTVRDLHVMEDERKTQANLSWAINFSGGSGTRLSR